MTFGTTSTLERVVGCSQFPLTKCHVTSDAHTGIQLLGWQLRQLRVCLLGSLYNGLSQNSFALEMSQCWKHLILIHIRIS